MAFGRRESGIRILNPDRVRSGPVSRLKASVRSLQASGTKLDRKTGYEARRLVQPWQVQALNYYDLLPEIKYAASFYSRGLANLELVASEKKMGEDGKVQVVPSENEIARQHLERIQDPGGGRTNLLGSYGRLLFLVGEAYLVATKDPESELEQWEMLSFEEIVPEGRTYKRVKAPMLQPEQLEEADESEFEPLDENTAVVYRLWKRHPRHSELADSTMEGVLELCEELLLLTRAVRSRARSRLAGSGILYVPNTLTVTPVEPEPDEDPDVDPFLSRLTNAMTAPIADEGAPSAVVPLVIRGPDELGDKIKHIQIVDPTQLYPETGLRRECIERIAIGLDMPNEILTGTGDVNHWGAWMIDEQAWKQHLQPIAQQLCDDLTASYYRPSLREAGVEDWQNHLIAFDAASAISHPNKAKDAKDLWDRLAISDEALRDATGFDPDDGITDGDEMTRRIGVLVRDGTLATTGVPATTGAPGGTAPPGGEDTGGAQEETQKEPPPAPEGEADSEEALVASNGNGLVHAARVIGAADLALVRARELAGNKIKNRARRDHAALAEIEGVPARQVAYVLGQERVKALGCPDERELVKGCRDFIEDAFRAWGLDRGLADRLSELIEQHAARTLYAERPPPLPATFHNWVAGALTAGAA